MRKLSAALLAVLLAFCLLTACVNRPVGPENFDAALENWQNKLKDSVRITDAVMPGSHDAGTKGMIGMAETQMHTVTDQLRAGARYFDLRVALDGGELKIFHSIVKGMMFQDVADELARYFEADNGQFLVLDFQHFENDSMTAVADVIREKWNPSRYAVPSDTDLSTLTMGKIREKGYKYIVVWGAETCAERNYIFRRSPALFSPYNESAHKKGGAYLIENAFPKYFEQSASDKFFVLQAVVTASNFMQNIYENDKKFVSVFNNYLTTLPQSPNLLKKLNIVMRDFTVTNIDQMKKIVQLNQLKGNFTD